MPRALSGAALARLRAIHTVNLHDICERLAYSATTDDYGVPQPSYTAGDGEPCALRPVRAREVGAEVGIIDAEAWVALGATWDRTDRLRLTHRYGDALDNPETYEIVGGPFVVATAQYMQLRRIDG